MNSPMMTQYQSLTRQLSPETILLFKLGDFYEAFFENAPKLATTLGVSLTKRMDVPMAGIPYHGLSGAIDKLVKAGFSVAIAEMTDEPEPRRVITREIAPAAAPAPSLVQTDLFNP